VSSFFAGCHLFIPVFDTIYDSYESLQERSPWTFDAILAVAGKIRSGNGPLSPTFYKCLEEAQGIARSSLFGPVVRKEAVQGLTVIMSIIRAQISYQLHYFRNAALGSLEHERLASQRTCNEDGVGPWPSSCLGQAGR